MITITTYTASLFSHDVYFEFNVDYSSSLAKSYTLLDIGNIKYEFDIPNSGEDVTSIGIKAGALDCTLEDSGDLLTTLKDAYYYDLTAIWRAKMYFRVKGGSYGNPIIFDFSYRDIDYKEADATVKISLSPISSNSTTVADVISSSSSKVYDFRGAPGQFSGDALLAGTYIKEALEEIYGSTAIIDTTLKDGDLSTGEEWFVIEKPGSSMQMVGMIATFEGAVFGSALGNSFYITRSSTSNVKQLEWDNVEDYEDVPFLDSEYRAIYLTQLGVGEVLAGSVFYPNAEKNINISFHEPNFLTGTIEEPELGPVYPVNGTVPNTSVIDEGIVNYKLAFGFTKTVRLNIVYWGIDGVYPYSTITFDVNAPASIQGKSFRVKTCMYDFKMDKVTLDLYEI